MGVLLDIDGTVLDGGEPVPGAAEAIERLRRLRVPFLFATNISRQSRREVATSLREAGLAVEDEDVLSASYAAALHLRSMNVRRVQLLVPPGAAEDFEGIEITDERPEAVVVGDMGPLLTFEILNEAFRNLHAGARLVAIHKNRFWKSPSGWTLDAGAVVTALEYAASVDSELIGKPSAGFFRMAAQILRIDVGQLSIVGDDLETDIAGGRKCGLTTFLVKTGKFSAEHLAAVTPDRAPHHVIDSVRFVPEQF
jgi:HAD superfamily hydrolase (TIGR01458 family)